MKHQLTVTGGPTGGSFGLAITTGPVGGGRTHTATIAFNSTAAQAKAAIEALPNMKSGSVHATGGALPGTGIDLFFEGMLTETPRVIAINGNNLTGGTTPAPAIAEDVNARLDRPGRNDSGTVQTRASAGAWGN